MIEAPIPKDEKTRLTTLRELLILDTPPEERFDRIVQFARDEFSVPIVLISLIDAERQWLKARVGVDIEQTPRNISFCGHAIAQRDFLIVQDARSDERFHDNPLVIDAPYIRFYAGAQLVMPNGQAIGTLCLISDQPRSYDALDRATHTALRDLVVEELLRRKEGKNGP